jgi:hypothetical protein
MPRGRVRQLIKLVMQSNPALFNPLWSLAYPYVIRRDEKYVGFEYDNRDAAFLQIFEENRWCSNESRSGRGSTLAYTGPMRKSLERYLTQLKVRVLLDAPCGDFNWMRHVDLPPGVSYIGGDIVEPLIDQLQHLYGGPARAFHHLDIVEGPLPKADLWLCRDVLFHLPNRDIAAVLERFASSEIPYLLTTTYTFPKRNDDIRPGGFRFINLQLAPFALPRPLSRIADFVPPEPPRYLGLWSRDQVARALNSRPQEGFRQAHEVSEGGEG